MTAAILETNPSSTKNATPLSSIVFQHLLEPLPYYRIDTNVEHEAGESPSLRNALSGIKGFPKVAPSITGHLCIAPEFLWEAQQIWAQSISCQDF